MIAVDNRDVACPGDKGADDGIIRQVMLPQVLEGIVMTGVNNSLSLR
jgi:hypothetical protein